MQSRGRSAGAGSGRRSPRGCAATARWPCAGPAARRGRAKPAGGAGSPSGAAARKFPADSLTHLFIAFICIIFYKPDRILYGRLTIPGHVHFDASIIYSLVLFCLQSFKDVNAIILQYSKRLLLLLKGAYEDFDCI